MEIIYNNSIPDKEQFFNLFQTTGWNEEYDLNEDIMFKAINQSWYIVSAFKNGELVGFGRVISDGILHALIVDMIVNPEYQQKGIGKNIMKMLLDKCVEPNICDIKLFCAKDKAGFYHKFGFGERPDDAPGMQFYR
jgi:GNAT superfamily N-acetyltransferase